MPAEPSRTVGQTLDDATITAKVKAALLQSPDVKGTAVNVDTVGGKVTLQGSLDAQIQIDRAIQIVQARLERPDRVVDLLSLRGPIAHAQALAGLGASGSISYFRIASSTIVSGMRFSSANALSAATTM